MHYTWHALDYAALTLLPYALMVAGSVVLWKRHNSLPAALMALGFAIILATQLLQFLPFFWLALYTQEEPAAALYRTSQLGQVLAGFGLAWYARRSMRAVV